MADTYYDILGISRNATAQQIKTAFREMAKNVHPDALPKANDFWRKKAEEEFKYVQEAYSVLSDPHKRKLYDEQLDQLAHPNATPTQQTQAQTKSTPTPQPTPQPPPPSGRAATPSVVQRTTRDRVLKYIGAVLGWFYYNPNKGDMLQ